MSQAQRISAAAAEALVRYTGREHYAASFTAAPGTSAFERGLTPSLPVTLSWVTFLGATDEAGSRADMAEVILRTTISPAVSAVPLAPSCARCQEAKIVNADFNKSSVLR